MSDVILYLYYFLMNYDKNKSILNSMRTHFIRPKASVNDHFLKFVEFITPGLGQSCVVWLLIVINGQETLRTLNEALPIFSQRNASYYELCKT